MSTKLNTASIVSGLDRKEAINTSSKLANYLEKKGLKVCVEPELAKRINCRNLAVPVEEMNVNFTIIIGGDGTILRTCLSLPKPKPFILAINMGVRGFLAEVQPESVFSAVDRCLEGKFHIERHAKLASFVNEDRLPDALNEVFVTTDMPVKILQAKIWKRNTLVGECQADGVMVASQVGSTGYSLSAGGPVLDPDMEAFVLTPVCTLTVFHPIVFSANSSIVIEIVRPKKISIIVDGHYRRMIESKSMKVRVAKSEHETKFIRFKEGFYQRLKSRLLFSGGVY